MNPKILPDYGDLKDVVEIDLHQYTLYEVQTDLPKLIADYFDNDFTSFRIVHGHSTGNVLQRYVRIKLQADLRRFCDSLRSLKLVHENKGCTILHLK